VEKPEMPKEIKEYQFTKGAYDGIDLKGHGGGAPIQKWLNENPAKIRGYRPTCKCEHQEEPEFIPGIVFDPFIGSGTTVKVAQDLLRKGIGIDISMEYLDLQAKVRIGQGSPTNQLDNLPLFE